MNDDAIQRARRRCALDPCRESVEALDVALRRAGDGPWLPARVEVARGLSGMWAVFDSLASIDLLLASMSRAMSIPAELLRETWHDFQTPRWSLSRELMRSDPLLGRSFEWVGAGEAHDEPYDEPGPLPSPIVRGVRIDLREPEPDPPPAMASGEDQS